MSATLEDILASLNDLRKEVRAMSKTPVAAPRFYTVKEACEVLRISRWTLDQMVGRKELRKIKRGGKVLFFAQEIETLIAKETRPL